MINTKTLPASSNLECHGCRAKDTGQVKESASLLSEYTVKVPTSFGLLSQIGSSLLCNTCFEELSNISNFNSSSTCDAKEDLASLSIDIPAFSSLLFKDMFSSPDKCSKKPAKVYDNKGLDTGKVAGCVKHVKRGQEIYSKGYIN